jgi:hypothetical protein
VRLVVATLNEKNPEIIWPNIDLDYRAAEEALSAIKINEITPPHLIVNFIDITHMTKLSHILLVPASGKKEIAHEERQRFIRRILANITKINGCLNYTKLSLLDNGFVVRKSEGLIFDRWEIFMSVWSDFCPGRKNDEGKNQNIVDRNLPS